MLRVRGNISPVNVLTSLSKLVARTKTVEAARADGEKIRLIGAAEARATEAVGRFSHPLSRLLKLQLKTFLRAEAERMRMKASAYKQYGDAAILSLVLEALPQIAAEVGQTLWRGQMSYDVFLGISTSCQDRPDCADWRRQQHYTCETLEL